MAEEKQALPAIAPVAAIVLAAGRSTRMGGANKLLCEIAGAPMVRHVVTCALASVARPVLVVTGHQEQDVRAALAGLAVTFIANPDYARGLMSSLKAGIAALPAETRGVLVALGDMPMLRPADFDRLIEAFMAAEAKAIVVPVHGGRRGNPVLWPAAYFVDILKLEGDTGARGLFGSHAEAIREVSLDGPAVLEDIDTPEALAQLRNRFV
jgi:molybdenum cofactor cytidylyltransferase